MYALSSIVKAKFNLLFLKEKQSPPLKVRQKQYTSAFVEEMTERKKLFFCGTQKQTDFLWDTDAIQVKKKKQLKNPLDIQQATKNSPVISSL